SKNFYLAHCLGKLQNILQGHKRLLNKSFLGGQGGQFFKNAPLAAGGKFVLLIVFCLCSSFAFAGNKKNIETKITGLLARVPAQSMLEKDRLCAEIIKLGPAGLGEICRMLAPPGETDDSKARFVLSALAGYSTVERNEAARKIFVKTVLDALQSEAHPEVKAFLIEQLQVCGKAEAVGPLGTFLADDLLCAPAARALAAIGSPGANKVLTAAFHTAKDKRLLSIINALGKQAGFDSGVTRKLRVYASGQERELRWAALYALGNSGADCAAPLLHRALKQESGYYRDKALSLYLLTARRFYEKGSREKSRKMCTALLRSVAIQENPHQQGAVLATLISLLKDKSLDYLLAALDSPYKEYRTAALNMARSVPGPEATQKWVEKARTAAPPARAEIIAMLGQRGDKTALPEVLKALKSKNEKIRRAAIPAAARLGKAAALPGFQAILAAGKTAEVALVRQWLLTIPGEEVVAALLSTFTRMPPVSRAAALDIFSARQRTDLREVAV
ncbi:MAG: HEAT repeat domain-containing protein, partial [Candidatus Aminicenantes bacterium]|nr:HEAT repeat domain-containing protein [Candidatus Aminicenantes bacterium]